MTDHTILTPLEALRWIVGLFSDPLRRSSDGNYLAIEPDTVQAINYATTTLAHYDQTDTPWPTGAVRDLRQSLGMTQAELAGALDISPTTIHNLERGNHVASRKTIAKLDAFAQKQEK